MSMPLILDTENMLHLDLSGIKLIEASAGTGKTYTIANFYLRHILAGRTPADILVVTFTNAATEELRGRIRLRLFQAQQVLLDRQITEDDFLGQLSLEFKSLEEHQQHTQLLRLQYALRFMDEAAISTIHSFCQRVLQDYALPSFQYFENELLVDDESLWQTAIKDWWRRTSYTLDNADWTLLINALKHFDSFAEQFNKIRKKSPIKIIPQLDNSLTQIFESHKTLAIDLQSLAGIWNAEKNQLKDILRNSKALSRAKTLPYHGQRIEAFVETVDSYFCSNNLFPILGDFFYLSSSALHNNSKQAKRGSDADLEHKFFKLVSTLEEKAGAIESAIKPTALLDALEYCSQQVKSLKHANRLLSYQDQLDYTRQALLACGGSKLAASLRQQFPVAMIDEFQDTDAVQYDIFRLIYYAQKDISLTLIGDPKQAIYSFRGGDIFTYMRARHAPHIQLCVLQTNWRSQPGLVNAVNHFFSQRDEPFIFSDSIEFMPVGAAESNSKSVLKIDNQTQAALALWQIPVHDDKPYNKETAGDFLNRAVAAEIVRLIKGGRQKTIFIGDEALESGDIAILVRSAYQGEALRRVLEENGIASVTIGKDKVFDSEEADGLSLLLDAVAHSDSRSLLRRALTSHLLNFDHRQITDITADDANWQSWVERFQQLNHIWLSRGFIPMFQRLMQSFELGLKLSARDQAERRLTNLLQLGELLQQQSLRSGGIDNLLNWFHQQRQESDSEEAELRLESDRSLVKIVTIHKSKGLEYPVVFLPYLWSCKAIDAKAHLVSFHNDALEAIVDLGSDQFERHCLLADKERLAEDIRLLYVALTRARSKVYLAWGEAGSRGRTGNSGQTALAYLLHSKQTPADLNEEYARGITNPQSVSDDLNAFVAGADGDIELIDLPLTVETDTAGDAKLVDTDLQIRTFQPTDRSAWRISSFSSLTRDIHQVAHLGSGVSQGDAILDFPAGSRVGLLLHAIFEHLDFQADIEAQCRDLIPRHASRFGLDFTDRLPVLIDWFNETLQTPLLQPGLSLSVLSRQQRLDELAFDFALDHADIATLNGWLAGKTEQPTTALSAQNFRGLITGVIDLVFEHDGKYYLADYKSNFLGYNLDDYRPGKLRRAMLDRRYDLQLLIYSLALHRYLRQRIHNYDYQQHFGGAYYLFLRAMRRSSGADYGVYFENPPQSDIEELDALLACTTGVSE